MKPDPKMLDLIPYAYALNRLRELPPEQRAGLVPQGRYIPARFRKHPEKVEDAAEYTPQSWPAEGYCPDCHMPEGQPGFVRMPFPVGHELFGRAICCPKCWPAPFGDAPGYVQSDAAMELGNKWERSGLLVRQREKEEVPF